MIKKGKGSGGPSLANIIKGKIKLFEDSSADDATKSKGLSKVISEIKKQNNKQEIKNHSDNFKKINEALKDNPKCKERLDELNQVVESLNSAFVTPSVPKAENKNIVPASNETKNKVEKIPPKKDPTSKQKVKKVQSIVKTNTPKVGAERNKDMNMFKGFFKNENSQITAKLTNIEKLFKIENSQISAKLTNIEKKVKTLDDVEYQMKKITKDTGAVIETLEVIETLPPVLEGLKKDINNINFGAEKKSVSTAPKDVQAIEELTKLMRDGLEQFDGIAKYYVSQQLAFAANESLQTDLDSNIKEEKESSLKEGEKKSKIAIANEIYKMHPTVFHKIKSIFEDIMSEKYKENEVITITLENKLEYETEIDGIKEGSIYKIITPAILIDEVVLIRATVEESK
jgi:hypothetical protein